MLLLPFLVGVLAAGWTWWHLPLLVAVLGGYLGSYFGLLALKTGKWRRYRPQLLTYVGTAGAAALGVVVADPALLRWAWVLGPLLAVNAAYSRRRRERAVVNDVVAIVAAGTTGPIAYHLGGGRDLREAALVLGVPLLYLLGTVPYVKTMIRERGSTSFRRASIAYHAVAAVLAWLVDPWLGVLFVVLLARAAVLPGRALTPRQVGFGEVAASVALVVVVAARSVVG